MFKLATSSVLWLPLTVALFCAATRVYLASGKSPLLNPTFLTLAGVITLLVTFGVAPTDYFESVRILHYLLGTAVVALAVPLARNLARFTGDWWMLAAALAAGSLTSAVVGMLVASELGAPAELVRSIAPKAATAAVSIEIARGIGGLPPVTACLTVVTGIVGAIMGPYVLNALAITSAASRGLALGAASHGIATARAFAEGEATGCWASLAMGLNAVLTAILVPLLVAVFGLPAN
jgi:putative effector of murein hydrolase